MSNLPIWARPAPGTRKPRFTREQIAAAALAIADQEGFDALCMRRVAETLGAGTMTLYYYVRTKADLLALMDDALMAEVVARSQPLPLRWRPAIENIARATYATFSRHAWALTEHEQMRTVGPNSLRHIEHSLQAVASLALPMADKLELLAIVDDFVLGNALHRHDASPLDAKTETVLNALTRQHLAAGDYPQLQALIGARSPIDVFREHGALAQSSERFERGLQMLLDGFSAQHGLSASPTRKPRRPR